MSIAETTQICKPIELVLSRLSNVKRSGNGWSASCPAHNDNSPSLSISEGDDGRVLLHCHVGCPIEEIVESIELKMVDLMPKNDNSGSPRTSRKAAKSATTFKTSDEAVKALESRLGKRSCLWTYYDDKGEPCGLVVRWSLPNGKKEIRPISRIGQGWMIKAMPEPRPLYCRDEVGTIRRYVAEGEKAADAARSIGLPCVTSSGGSNAAAKTDWSPLAGCECVFLPDNDKSGEHYVNDAGTIVSKLKPAATVKVVKLPGLSKGGDIYDWIEAHNTVDHDELRRQVEAMADAAPVWKPPAKPQKEKRVHITNVFYEMTFDDDSDPMPLPLPMNIILEKTLADTDRWPRRVGGSLFVDDGGIQWLGRSSALFGWLANKCGVIQWHRKTGCVSKDEFFAELQRVAKAYDAIETLPHYPTIEDHYYACKTPEPGDGKTLSRLIDCYCPATDADRQLILAMFVTPLWGGPAGTRPAFLITCQGGRGRGKSTLTQHLGLLYKGAIDFSKKEEFEIIKQRLLSAEAIHKRVATLDNVKTTRFSWAELESLITTDAINGKRLYVGDASRPNHLTWVITLNGASLSTDMAQRVVEIRLGEPQYQAGWEEKTKQLITKNREAIFADIVGFLKREQKPLKRLSRWATWESQVLARVDDPNACLDTIINRRGEVDVESEEGAIIEDYFAQKLFGLGYDPQRADVFIPNNIAALWYNAATGDRKKTTGVTRTLKQLHDERTVWRLQPYRDGHTGGRGFRWVGEYADMMEPVSTDLRGRLANQISGHGDNTGNQGNIDSSDF